MNKKLIILFGAPGSGKGYLGDCIKEELKSSGNNDFLYISTGDLLRAEIKAQTKLGKEIETIVSSGKLVSDAIVSELVMKALTQPHTIKILDGYPRTEFQMYDIIAARDMLDHDIISIKRDTSVDLIKKRVSNRRICKNCKATHSVADGCCPKCGGPSEIRKDDAVIDARLKEYERNTEPLWYELVKNSCTTLVADGSSEAKYLAKDLMCILLAKV